jgi:hypothetical protein
MAIGTPTLVAALGNANVNSGVATGATTGDAPAGSLIVVAISANPVSTLIDSAANTYTKAVMSQVHFDIEIWFCPNVKHLAVGGTFTATTGDLGQYSLNVAGVVSGANGGFDASGTNSSTGAVSTLTTTSGTTHFLTSIAFGAINGLGAANTYTEDINWTQLAPSPQTTNPLAWRQLSSIGTTSWTPSWASTATVDGAIATFKATDALLVTPRRLIWM